jgi:hypothetical protein
LRTFPAVRRVEYTPLFPAHLRCRLTTGTGARRIPSMTPSSVEIPRRGIDCCEKPQATCILHACGTGGLALAPANLRSGSPGDVLSHRPAGAAGLLRLAREMLHSCYCVRTLYRAEGALRTCACTGLRSAHTARLPARVVACPRCAHAGLSGAKSDDGWQGGADAQRHTHAGISRRPQRRKVTALRILPARATC